MVGEEKRSMSEHQSEITTTDNYLPKALIIGGVLGAGVGIMAAYLLVQKHAGGEKINISAGEGVKLGVLVFGMLRGIANL